MAETKIIPCTEDELLYAVPPDAKKAQAKVVPLTLSTATVAAAPVQQKLVAVPTIANQAVAAPSFFKQHQTTLLIIGGLLLLGTCWYLYIQQQRKKEEETAKKKDS